MKRKRVEVHAILLAVALLATQGNPSAVVIIRHDRTDASSLTLGQRFGAVGRVLPDGGCTLIAPTWAVTAAHVAASIGKDGAVNFGNRVYRVKRTVIHPEGRSQEGVPPEVDLALIELATPVEGITPVSLYTDADELGKTVYIVGNGDYGNPRTGIRRSDGQRRAVTNTVSDAGPRRLFVRFDEPPAGSDHEGIGAAGDSGGPALIEEGGRVFVAGVSSASTGGKPGQYGVTDVYTRVSAYATWVEGVISVAGG
jgi:hypothetical protein